MPESLTGPARPETMLPLIVGGLFALCFACLVHTLLKALRSGAHTYSGAYARNMARQFEDMFMFFPPRRIVELGWGLSGTLFFLTFFALAGDFSSPRAIVAGLLLGVIVGMAGLKAPRLLLNVLKKRRRRRFNLQLVDTLMSMSNALKAGFSITQAFETVVKEGEAPIAQEFDLFLQQTRMGVSFSEALSNLEQRVGSEDMSLVAMSIETARRTGGNLTEIFEKIATTIRQRLRIENRIRTLTAQGRLQGLIVGSMPLIIGVALAIIDPGTMLPFLRSTFGIAIMLTVVFLVSAGGFFIRKIINIDV